MAAAIIIFWAVMMGWLVDRNVLPHWKLGRRPDFRAVSRVVDEPVAVRWAVLHGDRRIGSAETDWQRRPDGWLKFQSKLELNEIPFLSSLGLSSVGNRLSWKSDFHITPDGNLDHFDVAVFWSDSKPTMTAYGKVEGDVLRVAFRSTGYFHEEEFYYERHSLMTTALGPIDQLPNLAVGQVWQHRVMNPLLKTTDTVRCEVVREQVVTWQGDPVPVFVVEHHQSGQMRGRAWVTHDGVVLRQEVPFAWTPIVLERE
jgi:hypothetical protein